MPVQIGTEQPSPSCYDGEAMNIKRVLVVTDKDGHEVVIRSQAELQAILGSMTPAELEAWKNNYRFVPILNYTRNPNYSGTGGDLK